MFARIDLCENVGGGAPELKRRLGRDRLDVGDAAHAISAE
jgi:hypothetical protein